MTRITLDLLDNSTHGRWRAQMGNLVAFKIPKDMLKNDIPAAHGMGLYFLYSSIALYVGANDDVLKKIQSGHSYAAWQDAVLILSSNDSFNERNTNYLWAELCKSALHGNYKVVNDYIPAQPIIKGTERDNLDTILQMIGALLYTFGRDMFDARVTPGPDPVPDPMPVPGPVSPSPKPPVVDLFYIKKSGGANATGCWEGGSITVLEGSEIRHEVTADCSPAIRDKRNELMGLGIIKDFKFTQDYPFRKPSSSAVVILGCASDGWSEWRTKDGKKLKELKRGK